MSHAGCPDDNALARLAQGSIANEERAAVLAHVDGCASCREVLSRLAEVQSAALGSASAFGSWPPPRGLASFEPALTTAPATVGRYHVVSPLGAGAMGVVLAAMDPLLGRHVALKMVRPDATDDPTRRDRLLREARIMASLGHPHVVQVYDAGTSGDDVFVAMELVRGETLASWLSRARRTPLEILTLFEQAGRGLQAAHEVGVVHRDFKPANVLVDAAGAAKVTDFGLSMFRASDAAEGSSPPGRFAFRTSPGAIVGTLRFMAPEQLFGAVVDARADQFAFAVCLYHALFGQFPYPGATPGELRAAYATGRSVPIPMAGIATPLRPVFAALTRALELRPESRYPSMADLLRALAAARDQVAIGHSRAHAICQAAFGLMHALCSFLLVWNMTALFANPTGRPASQPSAPATTPDASALELVMGGLVIIGVMTWTGFLLFGTFWAPINAFGLWKRQRWARRSTLAYAAVASVTCIGIPYAVYAFTTLRTEGARLLFSSAGGDGAGR